MKNTFLVILSVIVAIFIVICGTVIILMQFPQFGGKLLNQKTPVKIVAETTTVVEETTTAVEKETKAETTKPVSYTIKSYIDDTKNINISYPEISGMKDLEQQNNVNNKLYVNALSIVTLYPINAKKQKLSVTPEITYLDDYYITVVYTGQLENPSASGKKSNSVGSSNTSRSTSNGGYYPYTGSSKYSDNPSNNYQIPGQHFNPNISAASHQDRAMLPNANIYSSGYNPVMPTEAIISQNVPGLNGKQVATVISHANTITVPTKKIFYTNTIDLTHCVDVNSSNKVDGKILANYVKSDKVEFVNLTQDEADVKNYIKNVSSSNLVKIFDNSDFRNKLLKNWPTSFSYETDDSIYFSIPVSAKLGDYVLARYKFTK